MCSPVCFRICLSHIPAVLPFPGQTHRPAPIIVFFVLFTRFQSGNEVKSVGANLCVRLCFMGNLFLPYCRVYTYSPGFLPFPGQTHRSAPTIVLFVLVTRLQPGNEVKSVGANLCVRPCFWGICLFLFSGFIPIPQVFSLFQGRHIGLPLRLYYLYLLPGFSLVTRPLKVVTPTPQSSI